MIASANPPNRLAPSTSSPECVSSIQNSFITRFNGVPDPLDCTRFTQLFTVRHHYQQRRKTRKALNQSPNRIQYPYISG
jgi:hypothetical protein